MWVKSAFDEIQSDTTFLVSSNTFCASHAGQIVLNFLLNLNLNTALNFVVSSAFDGVFAVTWRRSILCFMAVTQEEEQCHSQMLRLLPDSKKSLLTAI